MDRIPVEILEFIFNELGLDDLLICKKVCPKFYFVIKNMKLKDLVLVDWHLPLNKKYFQSNLKVDCNHLIQAFNFRLNHKLSLPLLSNLKYLYIYSKTLQILDDEVINQFEQLIRLEIVNSKLIINKDFKLILKNLKYLNLENTQYNYKIYLDLPQLNYFKIFNANPIELAHPETVINFHISNYGKFIKSLINLEYLYCERMNLKYDENFLLSFHNLKEIYINKTIESYYQLRKQKLRFNRADLLIYYCGLKLEKSVVIEDSNYKSLMMCYKNNYKSIANRLPFNIALKYNVLVEIFKQIKIDFLRKFNEIDDFYIVGPVNDKQQLINLIKEYNGLNSLVFSASQLDQQFFNQLVLINKRMESLTIKREQPLDFKFLINLEELHIFQTDQELSIELIRQILIKFKRIHRLITNSIRIDFENNEYFLTVNSQLSKKCIHSKDLFN